MSSDYGEFNLDEIAPTANVSTVIEETKQEQVQPTVNNNQQTNPNDYDAWLNDIKPQNVDRTKFQKFHRTFAIAEGPTKPSADVLTNIQTAVMLAEQVGFVFRSNGDEKSYLDNIVRNEFPRVECYVPWKKFAKCNDVNIFTPNSNTYRVAAYLHKGFFKVPTVVRKFIGRNVNILFGDTLDKPLTFILAYTDDGAETKRDIDFNKSGNASFLLFNATDFDVYIFNFKKPDALQRFSEFIKTYKEMK